MVARVDPNILNIAKEYINVLREHSVRFESAWLFGSFISGACTDDSDIDIALVMKDVANKFFKEVELVKYRRKIDFRIEPHILGGAPLDVAFHRKLTNTAIKIA